MKQKEIYTPAKLYRIMGILSNGETLPYESAFRPTEPVESTVLEEEGQDTHWISDENIELIIKKDSSGYVMLKYRFGTYTMDERGKYIIKGRAQISRSVLKSIHIEDENTPIITSYKKIFDYYKTHECNFKLPK